MCVFVRVCVSERARIWVIVCMCVCKKASVCVRGSESVCEYVCMCVCVFPQCPHLPNCHLHWTE